MRNSFFLFFFLTCRLFGAPFNDFDLYQRVFTKEHIAHKIKTYLQKDEEIGNFYRLTEETLTIGDLDHNRIDYVLYFAPVGTKQKEQTPRKSLKNAKIAIDPGHFGGIFAELEERCVKLSAKEANEEKPLVIEEGTLTYLTALKLKALLENEGATVFITRNGVAQGAIESDFFEWLRLHPSLWNSESSLSKLFRNFYNREDLKIRAKKINAFQPDVTIIIHYNGHDEEESKLTEKNFSLAFIPGAMCSKELQDEESRYEFLRLLLTDSIEESFILSRYLVSEFQEKLKVPLINDTDKTSYTEKACLKQEAGIYSRNLALTRLVHSPLCYGETLIQNNLQELKRLSQHDSEIAGIPCSSRLIEVALAYFEGIKKYFK